MASEIEKFLLKETFAGPIFPAQTTAGMSPMNPAETLGEFPESQTPLPIIEQADPEAVFADMDKAFAEMDPFNIEGFDDPGIPLLAEAFEASERPGAVEAFQPEMSTPMGGLPAPIDAGPDAMDFRAGAAGMEAAGGGVGSTNDTQAEILDVVKQILALMQDATRGSVPGASSAPGLAETNVGGLPAQPAGFDFEARDPRQNEYYPAASPSVQASSMEGVKGAGGYGYGSFPDVPGYEGGRAEGRKRFSEPEGGVFP